MTATTDLLGGEPLRAGGFIVTVYGDVVEPRGGLLWMGALIEICALVGISETRVRNAVSRLVAAGRLEGTRKGRRSYYRLTEAARREFAEASARIFADVPAATGWLIAAAADAEAAEALTRTGFAALGGGLLIGADRPGGLPAAGLLMRAELLRGGPELRRLAAERWDLPGHAGAYRAFLTRFAAVAAALDAGDALADEARFVARVLLVHHYRAVVLRDPRLPAAALPEDWPGPAARKLFARLYVRLSPGADSHVSRAFEDLDGRLPAETAATRLRLRKLQADAA